MMVMIAADRVGVCCSIALCENKIITDPHTIGTVSIAVPNVALGSNAIGDKFRDANPPNAPPKSPSSQFTGETATFPISNLHCGYSVFVGLIGVFLFHQIKIFSCFNFISGPK